MKKYNKKEKIDTFHITVDQVIDAIGGKNNINTIFHCATRLRITLKNQELINQEKLNNIDKAKGNSKEGEQLQIIFGAGVVNKVYEKYEELYSTQVSSTSFTPNKKDKFKWNHNFSTKSNVFLFSRHGIRSFANIFIPLIPLFILGGLALALNNVVVSAGKTNGEWNNGVAQVFGFLFDLIGGAILGSLPVLIGYTAAKQWGGNPWLGAAMGLILIAPSLTNGWSLQSAELRYFNLFDNTIVWDSSGNLLPGITSNSGGATYIPTLWHTGVFVLGIPVFDAPLLGYQAQVVPTLLVIASMIQIEKLMKKISHESVAIITVPLFTGILTTVLAFIVIGPIGRLIGVALATLLEYIFIYTNFPGFGLGGAIIGALYAPIVVTGLHQGFLPIEATLVAQSGVTWITPIASCANIAQGIACLTAVIFLRNPKSKGLAVTGGVSANLGITEPAIFGVNINIRHIFLAACIGGSIGGYWIGMTQTVANTFGSASWIGLIQFNWTLDSANIANWYNKVANSTPWGNMMNIGLAPGINMVVALLITTITTSIATMLLSLGKKGTMNLDEYNKGVPQARLVLNLQNSIKSFRQKTINLFLKFNWYKTSFNKKHTIYIYAPTSGKLLEKSKIIDTVFKEEMMGKTFVIEPNDKNYNVHSPLKGKIANIFDTGHAITVSNRINNSLLMHIGLETSQINLESKNLKNLKFFKFNKLIGDSINPKNKNQTIVNVESQSLLDNGAKSSDIFIVILNESIQKNQRVELIAKPGIINQGDLLAKIVQSN